MNEVTIEVRKDKISIQAAGAGKKIPEIKTLLQRVLKALEKEPEERLGNEIILKG